MHGPYDPVAFETVRQVRLGLRRTYGTAPRRPLSTADIRQILGHIDRSTPVGGRDAAIILLGYASAMRRSELVALVTVRRSKTDQEGHGQIVAVARGRRRETDGGAPLARIAAQTRHKDLSVLVNRYIRPLEALTTTSSRDLGL